MTREVIKDVAAGVIGLIAVSSLAGISVLELLNHQPFTEPGSLTAIAMAALAYFFGRATGDTALNSQQKIIDHINNGGSVK